MLTLYSQSFMTATRMDGFSHVQAPAGGTGLPEAPRRSAGLPASVLTGILAALKRTVSGTV